MKKVIAFRYKVQIRPVDSHDINIPIYTPGRNSLLSIRIGNIIAKKKKGKKLNTF